MAAIEGWKGSGSQPSGGVVQGAEDQLETSLALSCRASFSCLLSSLPPRFPPPPPRGIGVSFFFFFFSLFPPPELRLRWVETRPLRSRPIGSRSRRLRLWSAPAEAARLPHRSRRAAGPPPSLLPLPTSSSLLPASIVPSLSSKRLASSTFPTSDPSSSLARRPLRPSFLLLLLFVFPPPSHVLVLSVQQSLVPLLVRFQREFLSPFGN